MEVIEFKRLDEKALVPTRSHKTDAGLDIYSLESGQLLPGEGKMFKTGIAANFIPGYVGMLADRSSMSKKGFKLAGGICDAGFTGEIGVMLRNISNGLLKVEAGDRIAQLLIIPICTPEPKEVSELNESERGSKGWGSSGK